MMVQGTKFAESMIKKATPEVPFRLRGGGQLSGEAAELARRKHRWRKRYQDRNAEHWVWPVVKTIGFLLFFSPFIAFFFSIPAYLIWIMVKRIAGS